MATYYIDPTGGDNTDDGSYATPWKTIVYGIATCASGDTLVVKTGHHTISADQTGTIAAKTVTIRGESSAIGDVVIDGSDTYSIKIWFSSGPASIVSFEGITFTNLSDAIIQNQTVDGMTYNFQLCRFDSTHSVLNGSYGTNLTFNFLLCEFIDFSSALMYAGTASTSLSVNLSKCLIVAFSVAPYFQFIRYDAASSSGSRFAFTNCIVVNRLVSELCLARSYGSGCDVVLTNNRFYSPNGGTITKADAPFTLTETGSSTGDPLFVDIDSQVWDLQLDSPCAWGGTL